MTKPAVRLYAPARWPLWLSGVLSKPPVIVTSTPGRVGGLRCRPIPSMRLSSRKNGFAAAPGEGCERPSRHLPPSTRLRIEDDVDLHQADSIRDVTRRRDRRVVVVQVALYCGVRVGEACRAARLVPWGLFGIAQAQALGEASRICTRQPVSFLHTIYPCLLAKDMPRTWTG